MIKVNFRSGKPEVFPTAVGVNTYGHYEHYLILTDVQGKVLSIIPREAVWAVDLSKIHELPIPEELAGGTPGLKIVEKPQ